MGSLGWTQCFWCEAWTLDPYIIDWIGKVLCDRCFDNHTDCVNDGYPPNPNAVDHRANALFVVLPPLRDCGWEVTRNVASFLESPWRPGAGSRQTPPPRPLLRFLRLSA